MMAERQVYLAASRAPSRPNCSSDPGLHSAERRKRTLRNRIRARGRTSLAPHWKLHCRTHGPDRPLTRPKKDRASYRLEHPRDGPGSEDCRRASSSRAGHGDRSRLGRLAHRGELARAARRLRNRSATTTPRTRRANHECAACSKASLDAQTGDRNRTDGLGLATMQRAGGGYGFLTQGRIHPFGDEREVRARAQLPALLDAQIELEKWG